MLLTINSKMKYTAKLNNVRLFNFSIPAYRSRTGLITCPGAGLCKQYCYAQRRRFTFNATKKCAEMRLKLSLTNTFQCLMEYELDKNKPNYVRIHDSGDWYSTNYFKKWINIISNNSKIKFYTYTKSILLFEHYKKFMPKNLCLIYSFDGKWDNKINENKHKHAKLFTSIKDMQKAGYNNATENDLLVYKYKKIGLLVR